MKTKLIIFLILPFSCILSALAGSATWNPNPISDDWNTAANWTPETVPNDPTDVATFGNSNMAAISLSAQTHVDAIIFDPDAVGYTINTGGHGLAFFGAGVVNNSANEQNFVTGLQDGGIIAFRNNATAANAVFSVYGDAFQPYVYFYDNATAGDATFFNYGGFGGAVTWFFDSATAGNATFNNFSGGNGANDGVTVFEDESSAATATIFCNGGDTVFHKHSTAANSTLIANLDTIFFLEHSTAGEAMVVANGARSSRAGFGSILFLNGDASAGDATLVANGGQNGGQGGLIAFFAETRGSKARVQVFGNGLLDISSHNALAPMSIGSLEGTGAVALGANSLALGRNHLSTIFSGIISDGNNGGSLTKVGTGTLTLAAANTYTGGTTVASGILLVNNSGGSGIGTGAVTVNGGTLGGSGIIAGAATVETGAFLAPAAETNMQVTLTLQSRLTLQAGATYTYTFKANTNQKRTDLIVANGVTINGALITLQGKVKGTLTLGTVLTVISNTSASPITGTFANLADGAIVNVNGNNLQASYSGGDGNDLTLTVVP